MYYFRNNSEGYLYCIDEKQDFMITLFKNELNAFIQYSWDKTYINRMLDRYMIDDQYRPYYSDISKAEFYGLFNSFQSYSVEDDGNISIEIETNKTK